MRQARAAQAGGAREAGAAMAATASGVRAAFSVYFTHFERN